MELSLTEMRLIVEALETLHAEYGRAAAVELAERIRLAADRRMAEIREHSY